MGHREHLGSLTVQTNALKSIKAWLKSLGLSDGTNCSLTLHNLLTLFIGDLLLAINRERILLTLPSRIGRGKSKAEEIILPAVLLLTPGSAIHWSNSTGQLKNLNYYYLVKFLIFWGLMKSFWSWIITKSLPNKKNFLSISFLQLF